MQHTKISCEEDIPDLCKNFFFKKENLYGMAWAIAVLFVAGYGSAVVYAINTSVSVSRVESAVTESKANIEYLNTQINKKLDIIIIKTDN